MSDSEKQGEPKPRPRPTTNEVNAMSTLDRVALWDREGLAPKGFVVMLLLGWAALFYTLASFVHDIVLAFVVVGLFGPLYQRLLPTVKNRWLCSGLVTLFALVLVALPTIWVAATLFDEASQAYEMLRPTLQDGSLQRQLSSALQTLGINLSERDLTTSFDNWARHVSESAIDEATVVLNHLLRGLLHLCVILVIVFYSFVEGPKLKQFLFTLSPLPDDQDQLIADKFTTVARSVLVGNGVGSVLQGVVGGVAMAVVGLPSPVLWGTVMSIAAFVPVAGVSVVVLPAGAYLIFQGRTAEGILFVSVCLTVALLLENVLKTKLMGVGVRVHEVLIFLGVLGGLAAFGVLGLLYGPLIVAMVLTLTELYLTHYRTEFADRFLQRRRS